MVNSTDEKIASLLEKVSVKRKELDNLKKIKDDKWATNCSIPLSGRTPVNIQTASEDTIVSIVTELLVLRDYVGQAADELGITTSTYKHAGYKIDAWIQDCKKRIAVINYNTKQAEFDTIEASLNSLVSPELRAKMVLAEIEKNLLG
jgi:hypothetical protein